MTLPDIFKGQLPCGVGDAEAPFDLCGKSNSLPSRGFSRRIAKSSPLYFSGLLNEYEDNPMKTMTTENRIGALRPTRSSSGPNLSTGNEDVSRALPAALEVNIRFCFIVFLSAYNLTLARQHKLSLFPLEVYDDETNGSNE
jgi:hypothetical protein